MILAEYTNGCRAYSRRLTHVHSPTGSCRVGSAPAAGRAAIRARRIAGGAGPAAWRDEGQRAPLVPRVEGPGPPGAEGHGASRVQVAAARRSLGCHGRGVPDRAGARGNGTAIGQWKTRRWVRLKNARRRHARLVFEDESGLSRQPVVRPRAPTRVADRRTAAAALRTRVEPCRTRPGQSQGPGTRRRVRPGPSCVAGTAPRGLSPTASDCGIPFRFLRPAGVAGGGLLGT